MRPTLRTFAVLALAVPLGAPALSASAAAPSHFHEQGKFADVFFQGDGTPGGLPGNYSAGELLFRGRVVEGHVDTFDCGPGETPWGDENEENECDCAGSYTVWGEGVTITRARARHEVEHLFGHVDLYDQVSEEEDVAPEEGDVAAEDVPFNITFTLTGRPSRSTFTDSYRDPESGSSSRFRETYVSRPATVRGAWTVSRRSRARSAGTPFSGWSASADLRLCLTGHPRKFHPEVAAEDAVSRHRCICSAG